MPVPTLAYSDIDVFMAVSSFVIVMWLIELLLRDRGRAARLGPLSVVDGMAGWPHGAISRLP
ncbi:hypothetical protein HMPREF1549_01776 [Actinomyces johnsonii F0510]|uniref:Uncharacterized protein n=1 Tax=Actinomyces johnsonii F0510 TaxID=1227262 RepID=U1RIT9_9ACTO|nr:hypothetical protein HMPREF1549_01776 [Actinomyces johnsonii F0510]